MSSGLSTITHSVVSNVLATENEVNMLSEGIIDPTKVTRCALENAASAAGILLTTECVITDSPKKESEGIPEQSMF